MGCPGSLDSINFSSNRFIPYKNFLYHDCSIQLLYKETSDLAIISLLRAYCQFPFWFLFFFNLFFIYSTKYHLGWKLENRSLAFKWISNSSILVVKPDFYLLNMPVRANSISWHHRVIFVSYCIVNRKYMLGNGPAAVTAYPSDYVFLSISLLKQGQVLSCSLQHVYSGLL